MLDRFSRFLVDILAASLAKGGGFVACLMLSCPSLRSISTSCKQFFRWKGSLLTAALAVMDRVFLCGIGVSLVNDDGGGG